MNYCHPLKPHQWNSVQAQGYVSDFKMQTCLHCLFILFGAFHCVWSSSLLPDWCDLAGGGGWSEILPKGRIIYWWPYDDEVVNKHRVVKQIGALSIFPVIYWKPCDQIFMDFCGSTSWGGIKLLMMHNWLNAGKDASRSGGFVDCKLRLLHFRTCFIQWLHIQCKQKSKSKTASWMPPSDLCLLGAIWQGFTFSACKVWNNIFLFSHGPHS